MNYYFAIFREVCTGMSYFVTSAEGTLVSPSNALLTLPTLDDIAAAITFPAADGSTYVVDTTITLDASVTSTRSSLEIFSAKEAFSLFLDMSVSTESFAEFATLLQAEYDASE